MLGHERLKIIDPYTMLSATLDIASSIHQCIRANIAGFHIEDPIRHHIHSLSFLIIMMPMFFYFNQILVDCFNNSSHIKITCQEIGTKKEDDV